MAFSGALPLAASATTNLFAAREQMAFTLAFHIVLACLGVALPAMVLVANYIGLKKDDHDAIELAQRWSKAMAVTFAVGAVTGTVLSFEFGLLWPHFMERFGAAFGIAFGIEGLFFFLEAIFLAIYIYGWKRLPPWAHFWAGVPMFITGIGGAFSVVAANSWMNQPQGFVLNAAGKVTEVEPVKVLFNPATWYEVPHMILAAYMLTGFLVASIYAVGMLKGRRDRLHRLGLLIPLTIACIATPVQLLVGDTAAREVAHNQPAKFAAMECVQNTGGHQTEYLGGICTSSGVKFGIGIPDLDSLLVGFSPSTKVTGLNQIPNDERPPDNTFIHLAFNVMVGIGSALMLLVLWLAYSVFKKRDIPSTPWFLKAVSVSGVGAILALWSGWIVTEVGRQPWIVYGVMRVSQAVTGARGVPIGDGVLVLVYVALAVAVAWLLRRFSRVPLDSAGDAPSPPPGVARAG
jgi:cytochrome d ubiquinol oxidase subunit I